jgi:hypothetical protein
MAPAPRIGTEFAGYRIEGLLGRGGMGVAYRAEHPRLGASVALKVMAPELGADEAFRERFVREARMAARIRHPNIVPIYDAGEWHGDLYMAMRYVEGDDLRTLLRKRNVLPVHETVEIAIQIAGALDAAHRNGLVHRDVKPGNILLEPGPDPDSPPIAYLADLGLTKDMDSRQAVTSSGELLGSIDYMAPEQISGLPLDGRADVYSLACVLFECLTGSVPYVRENKAAVLWAHLNDDIPQATALNPTLPKEIDAVIARGMAKEPADRFQSGRELVASLEGPLEAVTRTGAETVRKAPKDSPPLGPVSGQSSPRFGTKRVLALAAAVGAILGVGGTVVAILVFRGPEAAQEEQSQATEPAGTQAQSAPEFTPFDEALLRYVPGGIRSGCHHVKPLTDNFDASVSCRTGGPVTSLTYSHARSGQYLFEFMRQRRVKVGLAEATHAGLCSAGVVPSLNYTVAMGFRGRAESVETPVREAVLGSILCAQIREQARIDWLTQEPAIFATARGNDLAALYQWWSTDGGPEP